MKAIKFILALAVAIVVGSVLVLGTAVVLVLAMPWLVYCTCTDPTENPIKTERENSKTKNSPRRKCAALP